MADTIVQAPDPRTPSNAGDRSFRVGGRRRWLGVASTAIFFVVAISTYFTWQFSRDCAIERRLTGIWVSNLIREDGTEDLFFWQFLADGTVRHHPQGKPSAETESVDDYMGWHVSDGLLVLTYDREFPRGASLKWKANHAITYVSECFIGKRVPLARHDKCIIRDAGQGAIELSAHPGENTRDSWFGERAVVLSRFSDGMTRP